MDKLFRRITLSALAIVALATAAPSVVQADTPDAVAVAAVDAGAPPDAAPMPHEQLPTIDHPGAVVAAVVDAQDHGGLLSAILVGLFVLGTTLMRAAEHVGWLAQGRRLAAITGATAIVGAVIDKLAQGTAWGGVVQVVVTALALFLVPSAPATPKA